MSFYTPVELVFGNVQCLDVTSGLLTPAMMSLYLDQINGRPACTLGSCRIFGVSCWFLESFDHQLNERRNNTWIVRPFAIVTSLNAIL